MSTCDIITDSELALRRAEQAATRRTEAAQWLREMDECALKLLANDPDEEEFCEVLRNGLILCNVLNKVNPGAVSKVVESPVVSVQSPDAAAQSVIQYFENMRNFLVAVSEMKLLTFEASDLEKGGSSVKVVDCILCLKGYHEWKLAGGMGVWRYGGIIKIAPSNKCSLEPCWDSSLQNKAQLAEVVKLLTVDLLEESIASNALSSLFDQFGLQLLRALVTALTGDADLPLNPMLVDMVLNQVLNEFYFLLVTQKNQLGSLLKKKINNNGSSSKKEIIESVMGHINERSCGLPSCSKFCICRWEPHLQTDERVDSQQRQLEKLKLSFQDMKVHVISNQRKWAEDLKNFEKHMDALKVNVSLYDKLLEENRSLYNQVQDLRGNIRVYCRVKPFMPNQSDSKSTVDHTGGNGSIMIINPHKLGKDARKIFSYNKVFGHKTTQREVYVDTQPLIRSVMDGYNVCIFAYGQTGSGKTYTMSGPDLTTENTWGLNYRALNDLFHISASRARDITYDVNVQMVEIYNEQVRDLLVADGSNRRLEIRNNSQLNGLNIPDANLILVKSTQDVLDLMKIGQGNRAVGATALNERSSRSHSILTVHVQGKELVSGSILRGCLHLVDLAGSERVEKSEATGERLKEAQHINRSLSALGDVISALAQKSSHVPYRNSKLTQVLQAALGGQAKTLMFVHINPEINSFGETISTLKFAERVASIELGAARANKETSEIRDLKEEISKVKSALEAKDSEVKQLKENTRKLTAELKTLRNTSALNSQKNGNSLYLKPEDSQLYACDSRQIETRSCSSGKQRKPRFPSIVPNREPDSKSSFPSGENYSKYKTQISTSPIRPIKIQNDEKPIIKLQFPEKTTINKSITHARFRSIFREREEESFSKRKIKIESKRPDLDMVKKFKNENISDVSESENVVRISQNIEPRNFHQESEHENKAPNCIIRNGNESTKTVNTEVRRSRSLPRGKFILS